MNLKTCLLITDDPDDHDAFSEALSEISSQLVLIVISNSEKALEVLKSKKYRPDYIFVDLCMHGIRANSFLKAMNNEIELAHIPIILYGDKTNIEKIKYHSPLPFLSKNYSYTELRKFLKRIIAGDK
jgi:DNA-binding NtrC family response regulator